MPLALAGSVGAIVGAFLGLALPTRALQLSLGVIVLAIAWLMWATRKTGASLARVPDGLAAALGLSGQYPEASEGRLVQWTVHRTPAGLAAFAVIGVIGGMFGLGAGWANVPALTLLMGLPLKLAVGTSGLTMSIMNSSAAWVYLNEGALLPILHVPSILGVMLGARVGVRMLSRIQAGTARTIIIVVLLLAGARSLTQGLGF